MITMLYSLLSFALLSISAFALPQPSTRSASTPVSWITEPQSIPADSDLRLEWQGGDGYGWQVYYIPQWAQQTVYHPIDIVKNTTSNEMIWHTPKKDAYPEGTTFILGVNDGSHSVSGGWYDVSGLIPFVAAGKQDDEPGARRGWVWTV